MKDEKENKINPKLDLDPDLLQKRCYLLSVSIGQWNNNRKSKKGTKELKDKYTNGNGNGNTKDIVRAYKSAINPVYLNPISKLVNEIRTFIYINTLPYTEKGKYLVTVQRHAKIQEKIREFTREFEEVKSNILSNFEYWKNEARTDLVNPDTGENLFDENDYPTLDKLAEKYYHEFLPFPMPASTIQAEIMDEEISDINKQLKERENESVKIAMLDIWKRIHESLASLSSAMKKTRENKGGEKTAGIFRDSITGNIQELVNILPDLNIAECPELERMRKILQNEFAGIDPKDLRESDHLRQDIAEKADNVLNDLSGIF